jgi:hypothetical protein
VHECSCMCMWFSMWVATCTHACASRGMGGRTLRGGRGRLGHRWTDRPGWHIRARSPPEAVIASPPRTPSMSAAAHSGARAATPPSRSISEHVCVCASLSVCLSARPSVCLCVFKGRRRHTPWPHNTNTRLQRCVTNEGRGTHRGRTWAGEPSRAMAKQSYTNSW